MQTYDLLMFLVLLAMTLFGFWKGMAWQIAYVASFVVSYFAALKLSPSLAQHFGDTAPWNRFIAMLVIYVVASFVIWTLFRVIRTAIDRVKLNEFDHQMGALVGFVRGVLWCVAITFFAVTLLPSDHKQRVLASRSGHYIGVLLNETESIVPPEVHDIIGPYLKKIEDRLDPNQQPATDDGSAWPGLNLNVDWPADSDASKAAAGWSTNGGGEGGSQSSWPQLGGWSE